MVIGIELNHVLRDINKQILKYYQKDFKRTLDIEKINSNNDEEVWNNVKFDSKKKLNEFLYLDYAFEIFGSAPTCQKNLGGKFVQWIEDSEDFDGEPIDFIMFSRNDDALTIQSGYFFLSKIGCRVRRAIFARNDEELFNKMDAVISADPELIGKFPETTKKVLITREGNVDMDGVMKYNTMTELMEDEEFFNKITKKSDG